jgi:hypothetical protein
MSIYFTKKNRNIKKYCVLVEISWPEGLRIVRLHDLNNGKKHYSWRYFFYYWTELIQMLVSLRYILQIIYIYILILCISGDILTWRTPNRAIAWPENGKKHHSWRYFFYYWTELIQILVSLRYEYILYN